MFSLFCPPCINRNIVECKVKYFIFSPPSVPVLIETLWNVKRPHQALTSHTYCINRNIVECKVINSYMPRATIIRINRNIVECKVICHRREHLVCPVLIETLWNVKTSEYVNEILSPCINRNIVECKVARTLSDQQPETVLIETLWNVKLDDWYKWYDDHWY